MRFKIKNPMQAQKDKEDLRKLGYIQELDRSIGVFSNFAISFSVISILTGLNALYGYGLNYGGLASIWTWPLVGLFQLMVVLSLAEIASIYPVAGGVYKWTTIFYNRKIGWFCGWISLIGWIACTAGIDYGLGQFVAAFLNVRPGDTFSLVTLIGVIILSHTILNLYGIKLVKWFSDLSAITHIVGVIIIAALLLIFGRQNSLSDLSIGKFFDSGYAWGGLFQTLLMSAWTLTGFDASANVSEESINPSYTVPAGMVLSVIVSVVFGTLLLFSLGLATPDVKGTLLSNQPAALYVISQVLGPVVSKYAVTIMMIAMFACGLAAQTLLIRIIYALSRDNSLPKSNIWKLVSPSNDTPKYSIALAGFLTFVLCVLAAVLSINNFIPALPLITSLSTLGVYLSHCITLGVSLLFMINHKMQKGIFNLKSFSLPVKVIALIWTAFVCAVILYFNIASGIVFAIIMTMLLLYYFISVRHSLSNDYITLSETDLIRIENMRKN